MRFRTGGGSCRPNWGTPGDRDREASFLGLDPVRPRCGIVPDPDARIGCAGCQGGRSSERLSVEVVRVRVEPYRTPNGNDLHAVYVDWKNTSARPVRTLHADIRVFDDRGDLIYSVSDYTIYAVFSNHPGVAPGSSYQEPSREGHLVPKVPGGAPNRATVTITRASEAGMP